MLVLLCGFAVVVVDATTAAETGNLSLVTLVTKLPGLSLSVQYFEPRCRHYQDYSSTFFPDMRPINYLDFVYAP